MGLVSVLGVRSFLISAVGPETSATPEILGPAL